jgi:uncharacterized protein (DUF433 family)
MNVLRLPKDLPLTVDKGVMSGAPVFRGTRVPVQTVFDHLTDGYTLDEFLDNFPTVSREDAVKILEAAGKFIIIGERVELYTRNLDQYRRPWWLPGFPPQEAPHHKRWGVCICLVAASFLLADQKGPANLMCAEQLQSA